MADHTAIGIDIGGTRAKVALVASTGRILRSDSLSSSARVDPDEFFSGLEALIDDFRDETTCGVGLSLPGFLSEDRSTITFNPNTQSLVGINFIERLSHFRLPLAIEQDLNAPALCEYAFGAGWGVRRFMSASIGTGLGAAMLLDGRLLRIAYHTLGDSGHIILDPNGPQCTVGCHGCAEAMIATPAVERLAAKRMDDPGAGTLRSISPDGPIPARVVIAAAAQGDPLANEIMAEIGNWLGQWLASLAPIFIPEHIVLCGGVAESGEKLRQSSEQRFRELAGPEYTHCRITLGQFKGQAGVIGAVVPFFLDQKS